MGETDRTIKHHWIDVKKQLPKVGEHVWALYYSLRGRFRIVTAVFGADSQWHVVSGLKRGTVARNYRIVGWMNFPTYPVLTSDAEFYLTSPLKTQEWRTAKIAKLDAFLTDQARVEM